MILEIFFSYSHKDEKLRNELEKHLSLLKRQGIIDIWSDHRISPGDEIGRKIDTHLESADIILLLVSADFLNSNYCYDIEMKRAMKRHECGEAQVIPVILRPCDWQNSSFGTLKVIPTDGKAVTKHQTLDDAFLDITQAIRETVKHLNPVAPIIESTPSKCMENNTNKSSLTQKTRSSNLRIRQEFTDRQRHMFLDKAFSFIAQYIEGSLAELETRNPDVETSFKRIDENRYEATVYMNGNERCRCGIWRGDNTSIFTGIFYSHSGLANGNSYNESLSIEDDGFSLFLKPLGMASTGQCRNKLLTYEGAAEYYWSLFIDRLQ